VREFKLSNVLDSRDNASYTPRKKRKLLLINHAKTFPEFSAKKINSMNVFNV